MKLTAPGPASVKAAPWKIGLALVLVYLSWGTTYLAIKEGVRDLPPGLFGGVRVLLAGLVLLAYLAARGQRVGLRPRQGAWLFLVGCCMFVGGNGLINVAELSVPSGAASVLVATTPLWMALLERAVPGGDRLTGSGWLGLLLGLAGVAVLMTGRPGSREGGFSWLGPVLVLGSAFSWAAGSVLHRHGKAGGPHLVQAAWQMVLGGGSLALLGLVCGEGRVVANLDHVPVLGLVAFGYLLVVGSLVGFVAYTWLLGQVSAVVAGTYAYVNPVVALLLGWLLAGEPLSLAVLGGMVVILSGVALVRTAGIAPRPVRGTVGATPTEALPSPPLGPTPRRPLGEPASAPGSR
jgi:drug/metabolite transporter (DMT)-like permease